MLTRYLFLVTVMRGDQKVLQLDTLSNKLIFLYCWFNKGSTLLCYICWQNDCTICSYDVIV